MMSALSGIDIALWDLKGMSHLTITFVPAHEESADFLR
jgi:hypothetical protein